MRTKEEFNVLLTVLFFDGTGYKTPNIPQIAEYMMIPEDKCEEYIINLVGDGYITSDDKELSVNFKTFTVTYNGFDALRLAYLGKAGFYK